MKRSLRPMLGVTLLEIMLVLAVAAFIIVSTIRYYQSATASQQANTTMSMIQAITAAADNLAIGTGSYSGAGVSTSKITPLMPNDTLATPWNGSVTLGSIGKSTYVVTISAVPANVCPLLTTKLSGTDKHYTTATSCGTSATAVSYTYFSNP